MGVYEDLFSFLLRYGLGVYVCHLTRTGLVYSPAQFEVTVLPPSWVGVSFTFFSFG